MTEPGAALGSGERIGAYEIQGPLGRGGMGEVFLAWDNRLKRRVAIKRIRHDQGLDSVLRQRLLREARAAAGLSHPAIVQVHDLIEDAAGDCIVLEYVEGRTLAAVLADSGPLEPAAAVRLAREIADGLAAAHTAGIVHRDLKPENIIVTPAGHAKILDFGLAQMRFRAADDAFVTQRGVLLGTFHTMSPEQASGEEIDGRSDLFSLGVLLYEMLTGCSPFRGSNPVETLNRVLCEEPPRVDAVRSGIPGKLGELVERLLAKEAGERPESAAEVVRELDAISVSLASADAPTQIADAGDLPTVIEIPRLEASRPAPISKASGAAADLPSPGNPRKGRRRIVAALLAAAILGAVLYLVVRKWGPPVTTAPLRVLVLQPQVDGRDERLRLGKLGVRITSLSTLGSLEGVNTIDEAMVKLPGKLATPQEMARATAADEMLKATLKETGDWGKITLIRQDDKGRVLKTKEVIAPTDPGHLLQLADVVNRSLRELYKDHHQRPDPPTQDSATLLSVWRKLEKGAMPSQGDLDRLQQIINESQVPLDARLLLANTLFSRFQVTHQAADRDLALSLVKGAHEIAPTDPDPLVIRFRIEMEEDEPNAATVILVDIKKLLPSSDDPQVLVLQSLLAEHKGHLDQAIKFLELAVGISPTWQDVNHLADLEAMTGHVDKARGYLKQILADSRDNMDNVFALDSLAKIELLYGDLQQAEKLYQKLTSRSDPERAHYADLGIAQMLLGHYDEAINTFQEALKIDPNFVEANVNLAEVKFALGLRPEGEEHCNTALQEIAKDSLRENDVAKAECLAYLGKKLEATEIIQAALDEKRDDPDVLKSAALVSAVVGDRAIALAHVKKAIKKGVRRDWFLLPDFDPLKDDPGFQALINKKPGAF